MSNDIKLPEFENTIEQQKLPAGKFSSWLSRTRNALKKEIGVRVPCADCNACCRSSYFIHIKPDENQTLAQIPKKLLFPAPGLPKGNVVLGYDENGHCPMLIDHKCSIYAHRPITCRTYDCRVFAAADIAAGEHDKPLITMQAERWIFNYPTISDRNQHLAVQAAAKFLRNRADCFPAGFVPSNSTQLAILAIKVYDVFLKYQNEPVKAECASQDIETAKAIMEAYEEFEARLDK
jgi:hypothetical protein